MHILSSSNIYMNLTNQSPFKSNNNYIKPKSNKCNAIPSHKIQHKNKTETLKVVKSLFYYKPFNRFDHLMTIWNLLI